MSRNQPYDPEQDDDFAELLQQQNTLAPEAFQKSDSQLFQELEEEFESGNRLMATERQKQQELNRNSALETTVERNFWNTSTTSEKATDSRQKKADLWNKLLSPTEKQVEEAATENVNTSAVAQNASSRNISQHTSPK